MSFLGNWLFSLHFSLAWTNQKMTGKTKFVFFFKKKLPDNTLAEHDLEAQHKTESVILCLR